MWRPVKNAARVGLQPGAGAYALRNSAPSEATRSKAGVETIREPAAETCGYETSSQIANKMLGRSLPGLVPHPVKTKYARHRMNGRRAIASSVAKPGCSDDQPSRPRPRRIRTTSFEVAAWQPTEHRLRDAPGEPRTRQPKSEINGTRQRPGPRLRTFATRTPVEVLEQSRLHQEESHPAAVDSKATINLRDSLIAPNSLRRVNRRSAIKLIHCDYRPASLVSDDARESRFERMDHSLAQSSLDSRSQDTLNCWRVKDGRNHDSPRRPDRVQASQRKRIKDMAVHETMNVIGDSMA